MAKKSSKGIFRPIMGVEPGRKRDRTSEKVLSQNPYKPIVLPDLQIWQKWCIFKKLILGCGANGGGAGDDSFGRNTFAIFYFDEGIVTRFRLMTHPTAVRPLDRQYTRANALPLALAPPSVKPLPSLSNLRSLLMT